MEHANSCTHTHAGVKSKKERNSKTTSPHRYESHTQSVSVTPLLFPPWAAFKFSFVDILYSHWTCFQRALHHLSYTSADAPDLISRQILASLNKHLRAVGKQTTEEGDREEKVFSEWRLRSCVVLIPLLFVWSFEAVCSLVISLCWQNGRGAESRGGWERHIINQECFYNKAQTLSNPTHSHTVVSH